MNVNGLSSIGPSGKGTGHTHFTRRGSHQILSQKNPRFFVDCNYTSCLAMIMVKCHSRPFCNWPFSYRNGDPPKVLMYLADRRTISELIFSNDIYAMIFLLHLPYYVPQKMQKQQRFGKEVWKRSEKCLTLTINIPSITWKTLHFCSSIWLTCI